MDHRSALQTNFIEVGNPRELPPKQRIGRPMDIRHQVVPPLISEPTNTVCLDAK